MSFRSTFVSPGGFTTQRLQLILEKRHTGEDSVPDDPTEDSVSQTEHGSTRKHDGWRTPYRSESARTRHTGRRGVTLGRAPNNSHNTPAKRSPSNTEPIHDASAPATVLRTQSLILSKGSPQVSHEYRSSREPVSRRRPYWAGGESIDQDPVYHPSTSATSHVHSRMTLVRSHSELPQETRNSSSKSGSDNLWGNMTRAASANLDLSTEPKMGQQVPLRHRTLPGRRAVRRTQSALVLSSERSLTSRRFQQLFSSGLEENDSEDNSPDSLDEDKPESSSEDDDVFKKVKYNSTGKNKPADEGDLDKILQTKFYNSDHLFKQNTFGLNRTCSESYKNSGKVRPTGRNTKAGRTQEENVSRLRETQSRDVQEPELRNNYKTNNSRLHAGSGEKRSSRRSQGAVLQESSRVTRSRIPGAGTQVVRRTSPGGEVDRSHGRINDILDVTTGLVGYKATSATAVDTDYNTFNDVPINLRSRTLNGDRTDNSSRGQTKELDTSLQLRNFPGYVSNRPKNEPQPPDQWVEGRRDTHDKPPVFNEPHTNHQQHGKQFRDTTPRDAPQGTSAEIPINQSLNKPGSDFNKSTEKAHMKQETCDGTTPEADDTEGARSPRVSFSDDLEVVVPPSPSPSRRQWLSPVKTKVGEAPWETSGKSPVKGILQNGRKEGDIVLMPAPDDSEMRIPEDDLSTQEQPSVFRNQQGDPYSPPNLSSSDRVAATGYVVENPPGHRKTESSTEPSLPNQNDKVGDNSKSPTVEVQQNETLSDFENGKHQYSKGFGSGIFAMRQKKLAYGLRSLSDGKVSHPHLTPGRQNPIEQDWNDEQKRSNPSTETPSSGFTLSFKDFMTERKMQGKCILPQTNKLSDNGRATAVISHPTCEQETDIIPIPKGKSEFQGQQNERHLSDYRGNSDRSTEGQGEYQSAKSRGGTLKTTASESEIIRDLTTNQTGLQESRSFKKDTKQNSVPGKKVETPVDDKCHVHGEDTEESLSDGHQMNPKEGDPSKELGLGSRKWNQERSRKLKASNADPKRKDHRVGVTLSKLFRRSKKNKDDKAAKDAESDSTLEGDLSDKDNREMNRDEVSNQQREPDSCVGSGGSLSVEGHGSPAAGPYFGDTARGDTERGDTERRGNDRGMGFILGPHGHSGSDPLRAFFEASQTTSSGEATSGSQPREEPEDSDTGSSSTLSAPSVVLRNNDTKTRLKSSFTDGDRHSGVTGDRHSGVIGDRHSGVTGDRHFGVTGDRHSGVTGDRHSGVIGDRHFDVIGDRHFGVTGDRHPGVSPNRKPDYTQFLNMDTLLRNNSVWDVDRSPSSSGVSEAESESHMGDSLEDLAMALLEAELLEAGQEWNPRDLTQEDYQEKLSSIRVDLEKFSRRLSHSLKKHKHTDSGERAPSVSGLSVTSTRSSRSPWLRDPSANAKPITDPALRSKIKMARSSSAKVTSRDQKILELMMQKREEERKQEAKRDAARRAWETEKQKDAAQKTTTEIKRRESIGRIRLSSYKSSSPEVGDDAIHWTVEQKVEDAHKDEDDRDQCEKQWTTQSQRLMDLRPDQRSSAGRTDKVAKYRSMDDIHKKCERPWVVNSQTLLTMKDKKMQERRLQNLQRKKSQEERMQQRRREEEEASKLIRERQEHDLKRANSMKEAREQEQLMQRKLKNYYTKKKHEERIGDIKRQSREEVNSLQAAIEMKHATAQSHLQQFSTKREGELRRSTSVSQLGISRRKNTTDLEVRLSRSKENQQRLQEELTSWHDDLLNYRKLMERRADDQVKDTAQSRARRAAEERKQREKMQKKNLKKLLSQEEEWKTDVEATIAMKDARARMLQMEKDETVQESRAMAAASQRMREELRSAYSSDNIDQLSKRAQLEARIGLASSGPHPASAASKNVSHITLG